MSQLDESSRMKVNVPYHITAYLKVMFIVEIVVVATKITQSGNERITKRSQLEELGRKMA